MYLKLVTNDPYPQFDVYDEDRMVVRIKIDKEMQALRLTYKENQRVFFLIDEKIRKENVCTLVNEYSQPLGTLLKDRVVNDSGDIEIEGLKLHYRINSYPVKELVLYKRKSVDPVLNCRINDALLLEYGHYMNHFIFALSWFIFLAKGKSEVMDFAGM